MWVVGHLDLQAPLIGGRSPIEFGILGYDSEVGDELTAASEVSGNCEPLKLGPGATQQRRRLLEQGGSAMEVQPSSGALGDRQILQNLALQRRAESLDLPDPVIHGSSLELGERADAQVL